MSRKNDSTEKFSYEIKKQKIRSIQVDKSHDNLYQLTPSKMKKLNKIAYPKFKRRRSEERLINKNYAKSMNKTNISIEEKITNSPIIDEVAFEELVMTEYTAVSN